MFYNLIFHVHIIIFSLAVLHTILFHRILHRQNIKETSILGINYVQQPIDYKRKLRLNRINYLFIFISI